MHQKTHPTWKVLQWEIQPAHNPKIIPHDLKDINSILLFLYVLPKTCIFDLKIFDRFTHSGCAGTPQRLRREVVTVAHLEIAFSAQPQGRVHTAQIHGPVGHPHNRSPRSRGQNPSIPNGKRVNHGGGPIRRPRNCREPDLENSARRQQGLVRARNKLRV